MYKMPALLKLMASRGASDLFITAGTQPSMKVNGELSHVDGEELDGRTSRDLCYSIMNESQRRDFEADKECNFAIHPKKLGRFRVNVFLQQGNVGMVLRYIKSDIPDFKQLRLPEIMKKIALAALGLSLGASIFLASKTEDNWPLPPSIRIRSGCCQSLPLNRRLNTSRIIP